MALRQYVGARYTTKVYENTVTPGSAEWQANVTYEPLTLVTYNNSSYLSKKNVPASVGNPPSNPSYWVVTGDYNGQIATLDSRLTSAEDAITDILGEDLGEYDYYGILRCTSDGWVILDDAAHTPKNLSNLTINGDGTKLSLATTSDNTDIGTVVITPDEVFSAYGMKLGAAVNYHEITLEGIWDYDYWARVGNTFTNPSLDAAKSMTNPVGEVGTANMTLEYTSIADIIKPQIALVQPTIGCSYDIKTNRPIESNGKINIRFYNRGTNTEATDPSGNINFALHAHSTVPINWNTIANNYASWMDTAAIFIYGKNRHS